jgi:hypothetical protein
VHKWARRHAALHTQKQRHTSEAMRAAEAAATGAHSESEGEEVR